jgi:dTDP-L-rhamnose 4-epimerase
MRVLVTGGAGFIGSFLVAELLRRGHDVTIYDSLDRQAHPRGTLPSYIPHEARFVQADVRNGEALAEVVRNTDAIAHLAGAVGIAQSLYEIHRYVDVNVGGTAQLLDTVVRLKVAPRKIVLASSMTCYGEGRYQCPECGVVRPPIRTEDDVARFGWEPTCPRCRRPLAALAIGEDDALDGVSIYALTKKTQEALLWSVARTYEWPVTILRYFNVYGPRQTLNNPYTGVTAIFLNRVKHKQPPVVYEDGGQSRDFISVHDVATATALALERDESNAHVVNIGSGTPIGILEVARMLIGLGSAPVEPQVTRQFRKGDIRHCYADTSAAARVLKFIPRVSLAAGLQELVEWAEGETTDDRFPRAHQELERNRLVSGPQPIRQA